MPDEQRLPVLYSFRRCPYAMRARMALAQAGIAVEMREILLRNKPQAMLDISSKGTVPVLQLPGGQVIDESLDVMYWALTQNDPDGWLGSEPALTASLVAENDGSFKAALDRYKYHVRFPEFPQAHYRAQGEEFLCRLENQLAHHDGRGLVRAAVALADIAVFPFVRQFVNTDPDWFEAAPYAHVRAWLERHVKSPHFLRVMNKYPLWQAGDASLVVTWQ